MRWLHNFTFNLKQLGLISLLWIWVGVVQAQSKIEIGVSTDTAYTELKAQDNKKVLLWDNGNAQLRNHYNILATKRDWMRFYIDSDDNQNNAEFSLYKDTLGILGYDALPEVRFHLDGAQSWITGGGNLGIGTKTPGKKLDVDGDINFNGNLYKNNILFNPASALNDLFDAKTGGNSIFLGANAGINDDGSGNKNTSVGEGSLHDNTTGYENVAIGMNSSYNNNGNNNVVVGHQADFYNQSGWNNTILGHKAGGGTANHTKNGNIFIGALAGFNETGSNKLYIHNNNTTIPLIWGDFTSGAEKIKINGDFEVSNTETAKIYNLQLPTNAMAGHVLTSDATGNATWQEVTSTPDDDWGFDGNGDLYTFEKVGISTTASTNTRLSLGGTTTLTSSVYAKNNATDGYGLIGNTWATGSSVGVYGYTSGAASSSTDAVGIHGHANAGVGVKGSTSNITGIAVLGTRTNNLGLAGKFEGPVDVTGKLSVGPNPSQMAHNLVVDGSAGKSVGGTTWVNLSDRRLKDIHGQYTKGLDEINKLNTVIFTYKKDNPLRLPDEPTQYGFIAQEVQEIFPEAVGSADGEYLDFNFHPILVSMVNAIQELSRQNQTLVKENHDLHKEMDRIKNQLSILTSQGVAIQNQTKQKQK